MYKFRLHISKSCKFDKNILKNQKVLQFAKVFTTFTFAYFREKDWEEHI